MNTEVSRRDVAQLEGLEVESESGGGFHSAATTAAAEPGQDAPERGWLTRKFSWFWTTIYCTLVLFAFVGGYKAHENRFFPVRPFLKRTLQEMGVLHQAHILKNTHELPEIDSLFGTINVNSGYYDLKGEIYDLPVSEADAYGGIAAFSGGLVFVDGTGRVWFFKDGRFTRVESEQISNNRDAYLKRTKNIKIRMPRTFAVKDIAIIDTPRPYILASATDYDPAADCIVISLYRTPIVHSHDGAMAAGAWTKVFSTHPCLKIDMKSWRPNSAGQFPELAQSGGRIVRYSPTEILLSVGDLQGDGVQGPQIVQDMETDYGKILKLDLASFTPEIFSIGHRNPQGLVRTRSGAVFATEHGPQGGDELNHVVAGRNYGWPFVTFGTDYGADSWPLDTGPRDHAGYAKPVISWVPSIATSNLVEVTSDDLSYWDGDLLVSSLAASSLFRVRLDGLSPMIVEPIYIGSRIRDIVNFDGGFALQTDQENQLILLKVQSGNRQKPSLSGDPIAGAMSGNPPRVGTAAPPVATADTEDPRR